jgi:hypothetical protein
VPWHGASMDEDGVFIRIRDEGLGIAAEEVEGLFQPFHGSFARGSGLGLAIVHRIVTTTGVDRGGFDTGPGNDLFGAPPGAGGSDHMNVTERVPVDTAVARQQPRILVVDDEPSMRQMLAIVLSAKATTSLWRKWPLGRGGTRARPFRSAHLRHQDARHERSGCASARPSRSDPTSSDHDYGVRVDRDRDRGDASRRLRLPEQAVRHRSAEDEGAREEWRTAT